MINIRIKNFKGTEYAGKWNGRFYSSKVDDIPNLTRIYVEEEQIHIDHQTKEDLESNMKKYINAYEAGFYEDSKVFFTKLLNWQTKDISSWDDINITSWNHFKNQYIAEVVKPDSKWGFIRRFISEIVNKTGSEKNGDLVTEEPDGIGTLIEIKDGSHKNMFQRIYRKTQDGWMAIASRLNKGEWSFVDGKMPENIIQYEPEEPEKVNPLKDFSDEELINELCRRGHDVKMDSLIYHKKVEGKKSRFAALEME